MRVSVRPEPGTELPAYATEGAAGADVRCTEAFELAPGERRLVPTGLRVAVPAGFEIQMRPRSGLAIRHGIAMVNAPGTIDSDYRGEIGVILVNLGHANVAFARGERVAQMVLCPVARIEWEAVSTLEDSARGEGGFGSSGRG